MSKVRWAQWFWADWSNDSALNLCSLGARGLWMALLCLAAQGEPYGTVTIKGRVPTDDELFSLIAPRGTRRRDFNHWLSELEGRGVAQRDHRLAIVSPRMSHEGVIAQARIDAAHASWKNKRNGRNPRNLHEQTRGNGQDLHEQTESFASIESDTNTNTDSPPIGRPRKSRSARRKEGGAPFRNGFGESATSDMETPDHAQAADPPARSATVVPIPRRLVRC